jgi:hypothetical protein
MSVAGYAAPEIARVGSMVRKEHLKTDKEVQLLEDTACLVFLEHYLAGLRAKTDPDKLATILVKTWKKMSPLGHEHALRLACAPDIAALLPAVRPP